MQACELCTDVSTVYLFDKNMNNIMTSLNQDFAILSKQFYKKFMVLNPDKCFFMLFGVKNERQTYIVFNNLNSEEEKAMRVTIDSKLDFSIHLTSITKKVNKYKAQCPYHSTKRHNSSAKDALNILLHKVLI